MVGHRCVQVAEEWTGAMKRRGTKDYGSHHIKLEVWSEMDKKQTRPGSRAVDNTESSRKTDPEHGR